MRQESGYSKGRSIRSIMVVRKQEWNYLHYCSWLVCFANSGKNCDHGSVVKDGVPAPDCIMEVDN